MLRTPTLTVLILVAVAWLFGVLVAVEPQLAPEAETSISAVKPLDEIENDAAGLDAAKKLLAEEQRRRVAECEAEVNAVLTAHRCAVTAYVIVTAQGNLPKVVIVPIPEK